MTLEVGLATWMSDVDEVIARCKQLDVSLLTLRVASLPGFEKNRAPDLAELREMQGKLADAGITIAALSQWFGDDAALVLDPASHRREIDGMLQTLEVQGELQIPRQLHYVDVPEPADPAEDDRYWDGMLEIFREIVPQAAKSRVGIANHGIWRCLQLPLRESALADGVTAASYRAYRPEEWGGPYLVRTAGQVNRIVEAVPGEFHGYALCTGLYITGGDPLAEIERFKSKINFVQIRDLAGRWPEALEVFPGTGDLDFPAILKALIAAGYTGFLHPEHLGGPRHAEEDIEAEATSVLKSWVQQAHA